MISGVDSAIVHKVIYAVVNGATSTSQKFGKSVGKGATSAGQKAVESVVNNAIDSTKKSIVGKKRSIRNIGWSVDGKGIRETEGVYHSKIRSPWIVQFCNRVGVSVWFLR